MSQLNRFPWEEDQQNPIRFTYALWFCLEWDEPDWAKQLRPVPGFDEIYETLQEASNDYWRACKQFRSGLHSGVGIVRNCSTGSRDQVSPLDPVKETDDKDHHEKV